MIIVPGPTDRAFYKAFIEGVFNARLAKVVNLDCKERIREKQRLLLELQVGERFYLGKFAALKIMRNNNAVYITIGVSKEGKATSTAYKFLNNIAGLRKSPVDLVVVSEDLEDRETSYETKLRSIFQSLESHQREYRIAKVQEHGKTYCMYWLEKPPGVKLMVLIQGINHFNFPGRCAVEDFVMCSCDEIIEQIKEKCKDIVELFYRDYKAGNKKLVSLLASYMCYTNFDKLVFDIFEEYSRAKKVLDIHDGLRKLVSLIENALT